MINMSYGIVRVQKFTIGSIKGIQIHDRREKNGTSHTNPDIDWNKAKENYTPVKLKDKEIVTNYTKAVKERISELHLKKAVRKDAIVMAQVLVTSDKEFFKDMTLKDQHHFFFESSKFLIERYGRENFISATVHMDEKTPHMHFNFVPVTSDGRLSAKSLFTPITLREQQTAFYEAVGRAYGLSRGEEGSKTKHLSVARYKTAQTYQHLNEACDKLNLIICKNQLEPLKQDYESIRTQSIQKIRMERLIQELKQKIIELEEQNKKYKDLVDQTLYSCSQETIKEFKENMEVLIQQYQELEEDEYER